MPDTRHLTDTLPNHPTLPTTTESYMTTTNPITSEPTMPTTMPYLSTMYQLQRYHENRGYHFFKPFNMRFFRSRVQTLPPYKGRVFVTSEKSDSAPRYYSVRCITPDGGINTIGEFQGFESRYSAHAYAKAYADENFARVGNESVVLPVENKIV